jgi:hypothetical protein
MRSLFRAGGVWRLSWISFFEWRFLTNFAAVFQKFEILVASLTQQTDARQVLLNAIT